MDPKELSPKTADAEIPSIQDNKEVSSPQTQKVKKIIGVFLVKQVNVSSYCVDTLLIVL